jgi:ribosomal-protein-alanine N-acetyltransferase
LEGIIIRKMSYNDLPQVHAIEKKCFSTPWSINAFKYEITYRHAILKVAVLNNQIIGYVCLRTILDVTHVSNLAVLPEFRRRGIGSMLLQDALQELKHSGIETNLVTLEVRESNIAAIRLYEKFGFKIIGRRIGYYQKPPEDAIIMGLELKEKG